MSQRTSSNPEPDGHVEAGLQLATRLVALVKSGRAYSVSHIAFTQQLENYLALLAPLLRDKGVVRFDAPDGDLHLNGERLPRRTQLQRHSELLVQEFDARAISGIEFAPGIALPELQSFMAMFVSSERWKGSDLITACQSAGIHTVRALPALMPAVQAGAAAAALELPAVLGSSREAWAALYSGTQQLLSGDALDHGIELRHLKRLAQPVVDAALEGERIAAVLAHIAPGETRWAHAAHTALAALSIGVRLGLSRHDLADVMIAALLHDTGQGWGDNAPDASDAPPVPHTREGLRRMAWVTTLNRNSLDAMRTTLEHHDPGTPDAAGSSPALLSQLVGIADAYVTLLSRGTERRGARAAAHGASSARRGTTGDASGRASGRHADAAPDERLSPGGALARIVGPMRSHWHPALSIALVRALGIHPPGQVVELDDGSVARTVVPSPDDLERPWIELLVDERGRAVPRAARQVTTIPDGRRIAHALPRDQWPTDDARNVA